MLASCSMGQHTHKIKNVSTKPASRSQSDNYNHLERSEARPRANRCGLVDGDDFAVQALVECRFVISQQHMLRPWKKTVRHVTWDHDHESPFNWISLTLAGYGLPPARRGLEFGPPPVLLLEHCDALEGGGRAVVWISPAVEKSLLTCLISKSGLSLVVYECEKLRKPFRERCGNVLQGLL